MRTGGALSKAHVKAVKGGSKARSTYGRIDRLGSVGSGDFDRTLQPRAILDDDPSRTQITHDQPFTLDLDAINGDEIALYKPIDDDLACGDVHRYLPGLSNSQAAFPESYESIDFALDNQVFVPGNFAFYP
jgi:hypothetical protein